jgi:hypothetical protein
MDQYIRDVMDGAAYKARANLRRIRRESKLRDAMFRKPLRVRIFGWIRGTIAKLIAKGAR